MKHPNHLQKVLDRLATFCLECANFTEVTTNKPAPETVAGFLLPSPYQRKEMKLDLSTVLALAALVISGPLGWIVRGIVADLKDLRKDLSNHKTHVAEKYVEKDDLHRELSEIKDMVKRIFTKLDHKPRG